MSSIVGIPYSGVRTQKPHRALDLLSTDAMQEASRILSTVARVGLVAAALACGSGGGGSSTNSVTGTSADTTIRTTPLVLTTVTVSLGTSTLVVGQTTTAATIGTDQNGAPIAVGVIAWSSTAPSVATV